MKRFLFRVALAVGLVALLSGVVLAKPPDNHTRHSAIEVTLGEINGPIDTSTAGGRLQESPDFCNISYLKHLIWFKFTSGSNQTLYANTEGSNYDTVLVVLDPLTEIACDDDGGTGSTSSLSFSATSGTTYYFAVGAYQDSTPGNAEFTLHT